MQNLFIAILILIFTGCGEGKNNSSSISPYFKVINAKKEDKLQISYNIETNESIEMAVLKLLIRDSDDTIVKKSSFYVTDFIDTNSSWRETFLESLNGFKKGNYSTTTELRDGRNNLLASSENNFTIERDIEGENVYLEEFTLQRIYGYHPIRLKSGREASVKIKTNRSTDIFVYLIFSNIRLVAEERNEGSATIPFTVPDDFFEESNRGKVFVSFHPLSKNLKEAKKASRKNGTFFYIVP